jgi:hypothetical protein
MYAHDLKANKIDCDFDFDFYFDFVAIGTSGLLEDGDMV